MSPEAAPGGALQGADLIELYSVPILKVRWPDSADLNVQLRQLILSKMNSSSGVVKTNRGGWQSDADLHAWPEDCVQVLLSRIYAVMREMVRLTVPDPDERHFENWKIQACWANVNRQGHFNRSHHHLGPHSFWSGVYYVDVGQLATDSSVSGKTVFEDRSQIAKEIIRNPDPYARQIRVLPENGLMVLFPASVHHSVETYSGEGLRITIAYNMWHSGFIVPLYEGMEEPDWWWANFRGIMILPGKMLEKLRGLTLIPQSLLVRPLPRCARWAPWRDHITTAINHAFAQASARADEKRGRKGR
jgi:uncharacterized protein (TIGR02466 family)